MYLELADVAGNAPLRTIAEILLLVACPEGGADRAAHWGDPGNLQLLIERLAAKDPAGARRAYLGHAHTRGAAATP